MSKLDFGNFSRSRIEAFSDGVFAIIVTLLVLEIKLPHLHEITNEEFLHSLIEILPKILVWMNSFLVVCVVWMNHHRVLDSLKHMDAGIFWLNNILLMFSSLIPFPTAIIGEYPTLTYAVSFYGVCLFFMGVAFTVIRWYAAKNPHLLKEDVDVNIYKKGASHTLIFGPSLYLLGAALSFVNIWAAFAVYFFILVYFITPRSARTH